MINANLPATETVRPASAKDTQASPEGAARGSRRRRTQAERSAVTRQALLDATIQCIVDLGLARTSTAEICQRAGVSRGALLHHEPAKAARVAAAGAQLFFRATLPQIGSATAEGREASGEKVIANIRFWMDGHRPPDQVLIGL